MYKGLWLAGCKKEELGRNGVVPLGLGVRGGAPSGGRGNTLRDNSGSQLWFQVFDCNYDSFFIGPNIQC